MLDGTELKSAAGGDAAAVTPFRKEKGKWSIPSAPSGEQNARMWAMLSDVSRSKPEGRHWVPETWKAAFMHTLGHQVQFCEGLDNSGPFPLGFRSSRLSVRQMADLITCIQEYGDRHGVAWTDPALNSEAAAA